jgi:FAD synthase
MGELRRLATGEFKIEDSISLDEIECKAKNNDYSFIRPCYYQKDNSVITFGKFETLHLGHQNIINQVVSDAKHKKIKSVILIVGNNEDSKIISKEQRISKLKYLGVDSIFNFELNEMNMHMRPEVFVDEILIRQLKAKEIIVGSDCRFGYRGAGNSELLISLCKKYNVDVKVVDKIKVEGREEFISSTLIKEEFDKGNIDLVNKLLGK